VSNLVFPTSTSLGTFILCRSNDKSKDQ
jgi:hypothetical protein